MSQEITFGYITGKSLYATVYEPDGLAERTARASLPETGVTGYYHKDDANIQAGDFVMIDDGTRFVGQGQYQPDVGAILGGVSGITPAGYLGDYFKDDVVYFLWRTNTAPSVAGTIKVYRNNNDSEVEIPTGITDTPNFDGQTNVHLCKIDLSDTTFYQDKADYAIVLSGATIDGITVNAVVATFSIENRYALPTFTRDG